LIDGDGAGSPPCAATTTDVDAAMMTASASVGASLVISGPLVSNLQRFDLEFEVCSARENARNSNHEGREGREEQKL
jgi:hypothetical protein